MPSRHENMLLCGRVVPKKKGGAGAWRNHTAANPTFVAWSFCDTLRAVSNRPYFCPFFLTNTQKRGLIL